MTTERSNSTSDEGQDITSQENTEAFTIEKLKITQVSLVSLLGSSRSVETPLKFVVTLVLQL